MRTTDRRFIKTEKTITKAAIDLLVELGPESLSVEEIINEADINKSTFYLHYQSLDQLIATLEDGLVSGLSSSLYMLDGLHATEDFFSAIIKWCMENSGLAQAVFRVSSYRLNEKIENLFKKYLKEVKQQKKNKIVDENVFLISSLIQAETGLLKTWILNGCRFKKETILSMCVTIAKSEPYRTIVHR